MRGNEAKMQREEKNLTQRSQRKSTENTEKREIVTAIEELAGISPRSLHSAVGAPKGGAEEKAGRSGRDDRIGKGNRNPRAHVQNRHVGHPAQRAQRRERKERKDCDVRS